MQINGPGGDFERVKRVVPEPYRPHQSPSVRYLP
jgi:hypothetical protein